jgi:hypothetical protein
MAFNHFTLFVTYTETPIRNGSFFAMEFNNAIE